MTASPPAAAAGISCPATERSPLPSLTDAWFTIRNEQPMATLLYRPQRQRLSAYCSRTRFIQSMQQSSAQSGPRQGSHTISTMCCHITYMREARVALLSPSVIRLHDWKRPWHGNGTRCAQLDTSRVLLPPRVPSLAPTAKRSVRCPAPQLLTVFTTHCEPHICSDVQMRRDSSHTAHAFSSKHGITSAARLVDALQESNRTAQGDFVRWLYRASHPGVFYLQNLVSAHVQKKVCPTQRTVADAWWEKPDGSPCCIPNYP